MDFTAFIENNSLPLIATAAGVLFGLSLAKSFFSSLKRVKTLLLTILGIIVTIGLIYGSIIAVQKYSDYSENQSIQDWQNTNKTTQDYYQEFKNLSPIITTAQAKELFPVLDLKYNMILDVREDTEYDIGKIPGSVHIRSADLVAGERQTLDPYKITYVICAQSMRGKRIVEFLRSKGIIARYLKHGHQHYYKNGGLREGNNGYYDYRTGGNYLNFLNETSLATYKKDNDILYLYASDPKENPDGLLDHPISKQAVLFPAMYMTTEAINQQFTSLQNQSQFKKIITIYHGRLEVFDAVNLGIEAEKRGYEFLGSFGW